MTEDKTSFLYIVMPAYNEQDNIVFVVEKWHKIVERLGPESKLLIVNDGSTDQTWDVLCKMQAKYPQLLIKNKENSGHGATLLYAYKVALSAYPSFIFQTDSDDQTNPDQFWDFWSDREKYDVIIGHRKKRKDGYSRIVVTKVLKWVLFLFFGVVIKDANTPFRLMSQNALRRHLHRIPNDYNLTNVILSVLWIRYKDNVVFKEIDFAPRTRGKNSINLPRIFKIGRQALVDFNKIRRSIKYDN